MIGYLAFTIGWVIGCCTNNTPEQMIWGITFFGFICVIHELSEIKKTIEMKGSTPE